MPFAALLLSAVLCLALGVLPARLAGRRPARRPGCLSEEVSSEGVFFVSHRLGRRIWPMQD